MISKLHNKDGFIYAYIEWQVVNKDGQYEDNGEYIYVQDLWIQENNRNKGIMKRLIGMVNRHKFSQNAKYVYWVREKYNDRVSRLFLKVNAAKRGRENEYIQVVV